MMDMLFLEASIVVIALTLVAYFGKFLDLKGALAATLVGYIIYLFGGRFFFIIMLVFFVVAGALTRYRYVEKYGAEGRGARTWSNVLANGSVACIVLVMGRLYGVGSPATTAAFLGAVSAAFSDTMATEVGMLNKRKPRLITNLKTVETGTPGGVSTYGIAGELLAILILSTVAMMPWFSPSLKIEQWRIPAIIAVAGIIGSTADSIIGGLFQARYTCKKCGRAVEVKQHCGEKTLHLGGLPYINNDIVNIIATAIGALAGYAIQVNLR